MNSIKVLFVCMGNICRSPTAEGVFYKLIKEKQLESTFILDSAGTHAFHIDEAPDFRAQKAARDRGINLSHLRARKVKMGDFEDYDYLLAMDDDNYEILINACPEQHTEKVQYFLGYAPQLKTLEVPDPYYGGDYGFEKVLDLLEEAAHGFINTLQEKGKIK